MNNFIFTDNILEAEYILDNINYTKEKINKNDQKLLTNESKLVDEINVSKKYSSKKITKFIKYIALYTGGKRFINNKQIKLLFEIFLIHRDYSLLVEHLYKYIFESGLHECYKELLIEYIKNLLDGKYNNQKAILIHKKFQIACCRLHKKH